MLSRYTKMVRGFREGLWRDVNEEGMQFKFKDRGRSQKRCSNPCKLCKNRGGEYELFGHLQYVLLFLLHLMFGSLCVFCEWECTSTKGSTLSPKKASTLENCSA